MYSYNEIKKIVNVQGNKDAVSLSLIDKIYEAIQKIADNTPSAVEEAKADNINGVGNAIDIATSELSRSFDAIISTLKDISNKLERLNKTYKECEFDLSRIAGKLEEKR